MAPSSDNFQLRRYTFDRDKAIDITIEDAEKIKASKQLIFSVLSIEEAFDILVQKHCRA